LEIPGSILGPQNGQSGMLRDFRQFSSETAGTVTHIRPRQHPVLHSPIIPSCYLRYSLIMHFILSALHTMGPDSVERADTPYGLDSPKIESLWGRDFPHPSRPALGPKHPPIQWVQRLYPVSKMAYSTEVKETVEL
jgi:hypothetical protein